MAVVFTHNSEVAVLSAVLKGADKKQLASAEEIAQLREFKSRLDDLRSQLEKTLPGEATRIKKEAARRYQAEPTAENLAKVQEVESLEEMRNKLAEGRKQLSIAKNTVAREAQTLVNAINERIAVAVEKELRKVQKAEEKACEQYGIPFTPGPVFLAIEELLRSLKNIAHHSGRDPDSLIQVLTN